MPSQIDLRPEYIEILKSIFGENLKGEKFALFLFGSRVSGKSTKRSDIDIAVSIENKELDFDKLLQIKADLSESNLPYFVDVVDMYSANPDLLSSIKASNFKIV